VGVEARPRELGVGSGGVRLLSDKFVGIPGQAVLTAVRVTAPDEHAVCCEGRVRGVVSMAPHDSAVANPPQNFLMGLRKGFERSPSLACRVCFRWSGVIFLHWSAGVLESSLLGAHALPGCGRA
jgi:hypothetical protein